MPGDYQMLVSTVTHWIQQHGYWAISVLLAGGVFGLPIPDETLLAFAGHLVYKSDLRLVPVIAAACAGSCCGITISYFIGRSLSRFILKYGRIIHATPERIEVVRRWFHRFGSWFLVFGYFIPGVRHVTALVAGMARLYPLKFALFAYTGALLWSSTFIMIGLLMGDEWAKFAGAFEHHLTVAAIVLALAAAAVLIVHMRLSRSRKS